MMIINVVNLSYNLSESENCGHFCFVSYTGHEIVILHAIHAKASHLHCKGSIIVILKPLVLISTVPGVEPVISRPTVSPLRARICDRYGRICDLIFLICD